MLKFKRFLNMYMKEIVIGIIVIVIIIVIIQILNSVIKNQNEENQNTKSDKYYGYNKELSTGDSKSDEDFVAQTSVIQKFVDYCNAKNYEEAYNLLTKDCKTVLFQNIDIFKTNYCDEVFNTKKTATYQAWNNYTYQVQLRNDIIATGNFSDSDYIEDYYTVVSDKLNIKGYIKGENVGKQVENSNIKIQVVSIDYLMDYTKVNLKVYNGRNQSISLDLQQSDYDTVLTNSLGTEFESRITENNKEELEIPAGEQKKLTIKFDASYNTNLEFNSLIFKRLICYSEMGESTKQIKIEL